MAVMKRIQSWLQKPYNGCNEKNTILVYGLYSQDCILFITAIVWSLQSRLYSFHYSHCMVFTAKIVFFSLQPLYGFCSQDCILFITAIWKEYNLGCKNHTTAVMKRIQSWLWKPYNGFNEKNKIMAVKTIQRL
jgi:hypothetical protein